MRYCWLISVRNHTSHRKFKLTGEENEPNVDVYRKAKQKKEEIEKKLQGQIVTVELISLTKAFKAPDKYAKFLSEGRTVVKGHHWCPYCRQFRVFAFDSYLGVNRCPICTISDQDFFFKKYNGIFYIEEVDMYRKNKAAEKK